MTLLLGSTCFVAFKTLSHYRASVWLCSVSSYYSVCQLKAVAAFGHEDTMWRGYHMTFLPGLDFGKRKNNKVRRWKGEEGSGKKGEIKRDVGMEGIGEKERENQEYMVFSIALLFHWSLLYYCLYTNICCLIVLSCYAYTLFVSALNEELYTDFSATCDDDSEVRLHPCCHLVSRDLSQHGLFGEVFLRHEAERASPLHVANVRSHLAHCRQRIGKICGWFVSRYSNDNAAVVDLLQIVAQLRGSCSAWIGVVIANWLLEWAAERIHEHHVHASSSRKTGIAPRRLPDDVSI